MLAETSARHAWQSSKNGPCQRQNQVLASQEVASLSLLEGPSGARGGGEERGQEKRRAGRTVGLEWREGVVIFNPGTCIHMRPVNSVLWPTFPAAWSSADRRELPVPRADASVRPEEGTCAVIQERGQYRLALAPIGFWFPLSKSQDRLSDISWSEQFWSK